MGNKIKEREAKDLFWPSTFRDGGIKKATQQGVWVTSFLAILNGVTGAAITLDSRNVYENIWFLIPSAIYVVAAVGIWKYSRVAAIVGLSVYAAGVLRALFDLNPSPNYFMVFLILLMFVNGIRGTFAYHR